MRQNPYIERKTPVDITLCSLRKDMILCNTTKLAAMKGNAQVFLAIPIEDCAPKDVACYALHLKIDAPVLFNKAQKLNISRKPIGRWTFYKVQQIHRFHSIMKSNAASVGVGLEVVAAGGRQKVHGKIEI